MVKKTKNPQGVIDTDVFAETLSNTINLEGVQFPRDLFQDTAGLHDEALTVKLRCQLHMKEGRCPEGAACLKTHCYTLPVLEGSGTKRLSAALFTPTVGLMHFSLESSDDDKSAWKCRDDQTSGMCPRGARCTFLHLFEPVASEKSKGEKELTMKKRTLEAARPKAGDTSLFPSLDGDSPPTTPQNVVHAAAVFSSKAPTSKPKVDSKDVFPVLGGGHLSVDALEDSVAAVTAKSTSAPTSATKPASFKAAAVAPAAAPAPKPVAPTPAVVAKPATTSPNAPVKTVVAPQPAVPQTKSAVANKQPMAPPATPAAKKVAATGPVSHAAPSNPSGSPFNGLGAAEGRVSNGGGGLFDFGGIFTFDTLAPKTAAVVAVPAVQPPPPPSFDFTGFVDTRASTSGPSSPASSRLGAAPQIATRAASLAATGPSSASSSVNVPQSKSTSDLAISVLHTLSLDPETFDPDAATPTVDVVALLKKSFETMYSVTPSHAAHAEAETTFAVVFAAAVELVITYKSMLNVKSGNQKLTDYAERLMHDMIHAGVVSSACVSFFLSRVTKSPRRSRAVGLHDLLDFVVHAWSNQHNKALVDHLDLITILELINTCVTRKITNDFCEGVAVRIAEQIKRDVKTHDHELKRYVEALLLPVTKFGANVEAEAYITHVLRDVNVRVLSMMKPLLTEPSIVPPEYRSFDTMLYQIEQTTCAVAMERWRLKQCVLVDRTRPSPITTPKYDAQVYAVAAPSGNLHELWLAVEIDPRKTLSFVQWLPSIFIGQYVTVSEEAESGTVEHARGKSWRFVVKSLHNHMLYISLSPEEPFPRTWKPNHTLLNVKIEHNEWHLDTLTSAMRRPQAHAFVSTIFAPRPAAPLRELKAVSTSCLLDTEQKRFISTVLARPRLSVVLGPPGTGKTHSIVAAIEHIVKNKLGRVLALASSNYAANVLAINLRASDIDVMRIFTKSVSPRDVYDSYFKDVLNYSNAVSCPRRGLVQPGQYQIDSQFVDATAHDVHSHAVICTTTAHCHWMARAAPDFAFVFVDEAGQATFAEPLIPVSFVDEKTTIVLAGDPLQLGPNIISDVANNHGLGRSLLSSVMDHANRNGGASPTPITMLLSGYRNHREILSLFNGLFYQGKLLPATTPETLTPVSCAFQQNPAVPMVFVDVSTANPLLRLRQESSTNTLAAERYDNEREAAAIVGAVSSLLRDNGKDFARFIGIITAFRQQVLTITAKLREAGVPGLENILIGTVDQYQGQERAVIIISLVRTSRDSLMPASASCVGFIGNRSKTNVAISRAESLLVFVGDHGSLLELPKAEPWHVIASQTLQRHLVVSPAYVASAPPRAMATAFAAPRAAAAPVATAADDVW